MKILLATATLFEVAPFLAAHCPVIAAEALNPDSPGGRLGVPGAIFESPTLDCLVTGVGQMTAGVHTATALATRSYDLVIQAGLAGSFSERFGKRAVVRVESEALADLGAEGRDGFLDLMEMNLLDGDRYPFNAGRLYAETGASMISRSAVYNALPRVSSVTVNRVLGDSRSIAWVRDRYAPDIVNMEGAAVLYAALKAGTAVTAIRAISDFVGPRDLSAWDIPGSIAALNEALGSIFAEMSSSPSSIANRDQ